MHALPSEEICSVLLSLRGRNVEFYCKEKKRQYEGFYAEGIMRVSTEQEQTAEWEK